MFRSRICSLNFETNLLLGTDFAQSDMNEVTIPRVFNGETHCGLRHQFQRGIIWIQKNSSGHTL